MTACNNLYKRRAGSSASHGHKFEKDTMCLFYLRCLNFCNIKKIESFKIANNMDHVGVFDDIVCRIEYMENRSLKTKLIFMQTKHMENPTKNPFSDELLMPTKKKNIGKPTPILKYIESFLQICQILDENKQGEKLTDEEKSWVAIDKISETLRNVFNCRLEDLQFVYYTNAVKGEMKYFKEIQKEDIVTDILNTNPIGGVYKINLDSIDLCNMFPKIYENLKQGEIDSLKHFLNNFNVYVDQESYQSLEEIIKIEIISCLCDRKADTDVVYFILYEELNQIFCATYGPFLTEEVNFLTIICSFLTIQRQTKIEIEKYHNWCNIFCNEAMETLYTDINNRKIVCLQYRKLEKYKISVKCVQLIAKIRKMNKSFLFLFINKCSFEMWREIRNLHNYTKYSEVLVCVDNVKADDVRRVCGIEVGTRELIMIISENNSATEPSLWKHFSISGLKQIMNYNVTFQGVNSTLSKILGETDLQEILDNKDNRKVLESFISHVLNNEYINIGSNLPHEENIYIERKFKKSTTCLNFEALNEKEDMFIIYPNCDVSYSKILHENTNVLIFENKDQATNHFFSQMGENQNTHLCFVERNLELISSNGTLENILKYQIEQGVLNEEEFLQHILKNKYTILCDEVGMGKSTTLKRLTYCLRNNHTDYWTEYIKLKLHDKKLKNFKETIDPLEAVMHLLNLDDIEKMIFLHKCHTNGNVALLFDGFEEISPKARKNFLRLVKDFSITKIKTIVVSSRKNVETELKLSINDFHFSFIGFSYEDTHSFLKKYWSQHVENKFAEKLQEVVQDVVNQAKEMEEILKDIIAVPLQTKMLAETYNDKISDILSAPLKIPSFELKSLNLYSLYNNFINMHIDRCMNDKFGMTDENFSNYELIKDAIFKMNSGIWEAIACQEMFPGIKIGELRESDILDLAKLKIGIFVKKDPETVSFVHRSFAEFLAAKKVARMLCECKNTEYLNYIFQKVCIEKSFLVLRKFMNSYYENERNWEIDFVNYVPDLVVDDDILTTAIKEGNPFLFKVIIRQLSKNEDVLKNILNRKYDDKESLLILSAKHCEQVFDDILHSQFFECTTDCDSLGRTLLQWACIKGKDNIVKSYLSKFMNESLSSIILQTDKKLCTPLLLAAERGRTNIIRILQDYGASIHNKNDKGYNALICASNGGFVETVKYLIEQGAHINETDNDGKTVLIHACINIKGTKHVEYYVRYLVEQAGADVNLQDSRGRTALMHMIENRKINETLKFLIQKGADIKAVDSTGRNAITLAAKYGQTKTMEFLSDLGINLANEIDANGDTYFTLCSYSEDSSLLQQFIETYKPNLDYQNREGETALFGAVLLKKMEIINLLITHGASVNICNKDGDTALSSAVSKKLCQTCDESDDTYVIGIFFDTILKYLIEHGAEINHQNLLGNSALHLALRLHSPIVPSYDILELIKTLFEHGADIYLKNNDSVTPAMIAQEHEEPDVKSYFKVIMKGKS